MPSVGGHGVIAEREEAVVEQHHPGGTRVGLFGPDLPHHPGQVETWHHIGHDHHVIAEHISHRALAIGQSGELHDHVGVAVLDRPVRQVGVQQRFHRRVGRTGVQLGRCQLPHHVRVTEPVQFDQLAEPSEVQRRQP